MRYVIHFLFFIFVALMLNACSLSFAHNYSYKNQRGYDPSTFTQIQKKWSKTPYKLGGTSVKGADCSGFTQKIFAEYFNTSIPRTTTLQRRKGQKISKKNLRSGDLLFFKTGRGPNGLHVGVYMQNDKFIHLSTRGGAKIVSLNDKYWKNRYIDARRY